MKPDPHPENRPAGTVLTVPTVGYVVASRTTPGCWWLVDDRGCTCPADRVPCWHQRQVVAHCRALDDANPRPKPAGVNRAAFYD